MTDLAQAAATRQIDVSVTVRPEMPIYVGDPSELPLEPLIGPCAVADLTAESGPLGRAAVAALDRRDGVERVLLNTSNSALWERDAFEPDFVRLNGDGAKALVDRGVRLVAIDYRSIGDPNAHLLLLGAGVGVIEGLDLRGVDHGDYFLVCPPLKVAGSDGAPGPATARTGWTDTHTEL